MEGKNLQLGTEEDVDGKSKGIEGFFFFCCCGGSSSSVISFSVRVLNVISGLDGGT
jgi:hypothetical protein